MMIKKLLIAFLVLAQTAALAQTQIGQDIVGEEAGDESGYSVSLSADGNIMAVGAYKNDGNLNDSGHVRIYQRNNSGTWEQMGQDINGERLVDRFGISVSLSANGNTVAIGAYFNDGNGVDSGHVRIYLWNGTSWIQKGLDIDGEAAEDQSGWSVSLSADGNTVAIGARLNNDNGNHSGQVRIYTWDTANWQKVGQDIDGQSADDQFGFAVSLSADGNTVAIGAPFNDGAGNNAGHVRIYEKNGSTWQQVGQDIQGEAVGDEFGSSVSLNANGTIVALGAPLNGGSAIGSGHVRIYSRNGSLWEQVGQTLQGESVGDQSGGSVSLSSDGETVAIGARRNDDNGNDSGHVRIYSNNAGNWQQVGQDIDGEAADDESGRSVSLSANGNTVAIGAPLSDANGSDSGQVRVFDIKQNVPPNASCGTDLKFILAPDGTLTLTGEQINDGSGDPDGDTLTYTLSPNTFTSADAGPSVPVTLTVSDGNGGEDSCTTTITITEYADVLFEQIGLDIDGEAAGDQSGTSVSISADGNTVAIGALFNDANGNNSGHARIYQRDNTGNWQQLGQDIDGESTNYRLGSSVSLSADASIVAIGAPFHFIPGVGALTGRVLVYKFNEGTNIWEQFGGNIDGEIGLERSGSSVSLSADGTTVAVGAPESSGASGKMRIYKLNGGVWQKVGQNIDGDSSGDRLGISVSVSANGNIVAAGAPQNNGAATEPGYVRIFNLDGDNWQQLGLDINGEAADDQSGTSLSLSADGNTVAIGAPLNNNSNGSNAGQVRIFENNAGTWQQIGEDIDGAALNHNSGSSVSLNTDGSTVAIGARIAGQVRLFQNFNANWQQIGQDLNGEGANSQFGASVSLNAAGRTVAVGSPLNDGINGSDSGHVRVYDIATPNTPPTASCASGLEFTLGPDNTLTLTGSQINDGSSDVDGDALTYTLSRNTFTCDDVGTDVEVTLTVSDPDGDEDSCTTMITINEYADTIFTQLGDDIDGAAANDQFGTSVSISADGNTVVIGAPFNDANGDNSGQARIYQRDNAGNWQQLGQNIDGDATNYRLGTSVSLSADASIVAIGAPFHFIPGVGALAGRVRIYQFNEGTSSWEQLGGNIDGEAGSERSGVSISLSADGTTVAVGAPLNSAGGNTSGTVRIYKLDGASWQKIGQDINGEAVNDNSGSSVSLSASGNTVAIGAPFNDGTGSNSGHVRIFTLSGVTWVQQGQDINGEAAEDQSGNSVSLSADGQTVAIGAPFNDGTASDAGHVRIFNLNGINWQKVGQDIDGEAGNDRFGSSVSLNTDGKTIAIGARLNGGIGGSGTGHVRIYQIFDTNWQQIGQDIDGEGAGYESGSSVSLSTDGRTVAIGAPATNGNQVRVYGSTPVVIPPTAVAQNFTLQLGSDGTATLSPSDVNNGSTDNCTAEEDLILSLDRTSFDCDDVSSTIQVTLTVEDASGNQDTAVAQVTVLRPAFTYNGTDWSPNDPSNLSQPAPFCANIIISSGSAVIAGDFTANDIQILGGSLSFDGTGTLAGNIENNAAFDAQDGTIVFVGSVATDHTISGSSTVEIGNVTLANESDEQTLTLSSTFDNTGTVADDRILNIYGRLSLNDNRLVTNDELVFKSSAAGTGIIGQTGSATIIGNVVVERHTSLVRSYRLLTAPVTGGTLKSNWMEGVNNPDRTTNLNPNPGFGTHITGNGGDDDGWDVTETNNTSIYVVNNQAEPAAYATLPSSEESMQVGKGYLIFVRGDRSIDLTRNDSEGSTVLRANGTLTTGNVTLDENTLNLGDYEAGGNGSSLVANPYQTPIDMEAVLNSATDLNQNIYHIYDPTLGDRGAFVSVNFGGTPASDFNQFSFVAPDGSVISESDANRYLQPGQAAFITTLDPGTDGTATPSMTFAESNKFLGSTNDGVFLKGRLNAQALKSSISVSLFQASEFVEDAKPRDAVLVRFDNSYSNGADGQDGRKSTNLDENIATVVNDNQLSIDNRFTPVVGDEIQLKLTNYRNSEYILRIAIAGQENLEVYLVDKYLNKETLLNQDILNNISFSVKASDSESSASDRFKVVFRENALGQNDFELLGFSVFPNPIKDILTVVIPEAENKVKMTLHTILGQQVMSTQVSSGSTIIDVNQLQAGVYLVTLQTSRGTFTKRLIKE
ncbi:MAG: T9SS type A sorting domain-containing protein [Leeuwenhoekiella sp.]